MALDVLSNATSGPVVEAISQTVEHILETLIAAKNVLVKKESFKDLTDYLERIVPILGELNKKTVNNSGSIDHIVDILNRETRKAKQLTVECCKKNKVFLLMNCRSIVNRLEGISKEISRALDLIPLMSLELSSSIIEDIKKLSGNMHRAEFKAAIAEEEILEKIESGIQERNMDRSYANNLINLIAEAVGISTERSALKQEFEEFKNEIENARLQKDLAEAIQMDQIIALLGRADAVSTPKEKETKYFSKRRSLGNQPLEPLHSFICPITRDVMLDPVETSSGHTFERTAIEKWFADGNTSCPLTLTPVDTSVLRPNKTLRLSIEEWKDRNTMITISSMKQKLESGDEEEIIRCLEQLQDLCQQRDQHREWMILEDYILVLIPILGSKNREARNRVLAILCMLARDSDDAKERIAKTDKSIEYIVLSLGRRLGEAKLAVALLLELSKYDLAREQIGKVQGCILLLVTISSSEDNLAAKDATELLDNLSVSDQNVLQMAKANFFKHLLERLSSGTQNVKMIMARTVAELELTDRNKESLMDGGILVPLMDLLSGSDIKMKTVAIKALQSLSSLPQNGLKMIHEGAVRSLLDLLFLHGSSSFRKDVAVTIKQLALSIKSQDDQSQVSLFESDADISKLFYLINLTGHEVQENIIQTFYALCESTSASYIKTKLIEFSAIQVMVQLCENGNLDVRANAVKLFSSLLESCNEPVILENVDRKCLETLLQIIRNSNDDEEIVSALTIITSLPEVPQITQSLLDAGALAVIVPYLQERRHNGPHKNKLVDNAVGALYRFTDPSNREWQRAAAETGIIPLLVQLVENGTTSSTKQRSALALSRFSQSSQVLSRPMPKRKGLWCFAPGELGCTVHGGICTIKSSFCLVEADAVWPLVKALGEPDPGVCEAALDALLSLIEGERLQTGSKVLSKENAIPLMIRLLSSPYPSLQEKALNAIERMFRLLELKETYGTSAQMYLVDLTQRGSGSTRSLAARTLAHLNVLRDQSSFF